jgi:hypothetical protein
MRRWLIFAALSALALAGCPPPPEPMDAGTGAHCLDRPGAQAPLNGQLPCELLPPGFKP